MDIIIRKGTRDDLSAVYGLVKELALYEKAPEAVKSSVEDYHKAWDSKLIDTIVADAEGELIGMAIFYDTFSTWRGKMLYLEDFVVKEQFRGSGVGSKIYERFLQEADERNCTMVKWQVLDWNVHAIRFYEKRGATIEKDWYNVKKFLK